MLTPSAGEASAAYWQLFLLISARAVRGVTARVVACNVQDSDVARFEIEDQSLSLDHRPRIVSLGGVIGPSRLELPR